MHLDRYSVFANTDHKYYEFYSEGPKGRIKKVIYYQPLKHLGENFFNLAFGDWIEGEKRVDDKITTNNNDRQKILATVASTAFEFINHYPGAIIYVEGSTPSRTRLYQMGISAYWREISEEVEIFGFMLEDWEPFHPGRNYEAFAVKVKS
jgi:hypothetical protein